jgi:hypothetical protein
MLHIPIPWYVYLTKLQPQNCESPVNRCISSGPRVEVEFNLYDAVADETINVELTTHGEVVISTIFPIRYEI